MTTSVDSQIIESWQQVLAPYNIGYRITLLSQLLKRKLSERLDPFGLTPFHWVVLCCLWQEDGLPTSSIGDKLQQVGGTLTGVLDRMEERHLIRRERDRDDRRICRIWLTTAGKELETLLPPIVAELKEETWQGTTAAERDHFSQMINLAIANLS